MDKKLTLSLNSTIIDKAKTYAKENNTSLSKMIESYLGCLTEATDENKEAIKISPLVNSLSGIIELDDDFDYKKSYRQHLVKKYK